MVKVNDYEVPENLYYHKEYLWARVEEDGKVKIGLIDYAQKQINDIIYVELPSVGDSITKDEPFGILESVKAVSDLIAPVSGTIESVNQELDSKPELLNEDPYNQGWIITVEPTNLEEDLKTLLSFDAAIEWHNSLVKAEKTEQE
jgi:glycine cleavage system H protein